MLGLIVIAALTQAPVDGVWVVTTKRQGVAANSAAELIKTVESRLDFPRAAPTQDLTVCKAKLPCLLAAAKKQHAGYLVTVEAARVVDQLIVKLSLLSVEEDGRAIATRVVEGPAERVTAQLSAAVDEALVPPLRKIFPAPTPPPVAVAVAPTPPPPEPEPVNPQPAESSQLKPPDAVIVTQAPKGTATRTAGVVVGALGVAGLAASAVLGGLTLDAVARRDLACPPGLQCNDPAALTLHDRAATTQDLGIAVAAGSAALLVTGTILFIVGAPANATRIAVVPSNSGASVFVSASF